LSSHDRRRYVVALAAVAAGLGAIVVLRPFATHDAHARPELQRVLDGLVTGPNRVAPGVAAYVIGPRGTWSGAAGVANVATGERMTTDARFRIESNSKTYLVAAALQLVRERKLRLEDTVEHWYPGLLHRNGELITLRELMTDTSGLIDDNDLNTAQATRKALANVGDPRLLAQLIALARRVSSGEAVYASPVPLIRLAGWQPLLFTPGTRYHHGNIGWNLAGMIVARAAGKPLADVYRERIFAPLGLTNTRYDPQGPIQGRHAHGYALLKDGKVADRTSVHAFKGADGAIVTSARDEATFLRAFWTGKLVDRRDLLAFYGTGGAAGGCPGDARDGIGTGDGYRSFTWSDGTFGKRFAVLLLNGNRSGSPPVDPIPERASRRLYCAS